MTNLDDTFLILAKEVIRALKEAQTEGWLAPIDVPYMKRSIEITKFEKSGFGITSNYVPISKREWSKPLVLIRQNTEFMNRPPFRRAIELIQDVSGVNETQAELWLSWFVGRIAHDQLQTQRSHSLVSMAKMLEDDILCVQKKYYLTAHLLGIWLEFDSVTLGKIKLRRPVSEDLEYEFRENTALFQAEFMPSLQRSYPSAILETEIRAVSQPDFHNQYNRLLTALRLFRLGSVFMQNFSYSANSIIQSGGSGTSTRAPPINFRYDIVKDDISNLRKFLRIVSPLIPDSWHSTPHEQNTELSIAFQRFNTGLFDDGVPGKRLSTAVMGLEAIFLGPGEMGELKRRLSQRVSLFASYLGYDGLEVNRTLSRSYGIRSAYVHGSVVKKVQDEVILLAEFSMELLRLSILILLVNRDGLSKIDLSLMLDDALLGDKKSEKGLKLIVNNSLKVLVDYPRKPPENSDE